MSAVDRAARNRRGWRRRGLMVAASVALVSVPQASLAAGADAPESWLGLPTWVWAWANLFVLFGILFKFAGPFVKNFFTDRRKDINSSLELAKKQRQDAENMRDELNKQIAELKQQMQEMVDRAKAEGERERDEILQQAEAERERLIAQTQAEIDNRVHRARAELREHATQLASELAREQISDQLSAADQSRLFSENLARLRERVS